MPGDEIQVKDREAAENLGRMIEADSRAVTSGIKTWIVAQVILILVAAGYMTYLYALVDEWDADAVTGAAAGALVESLPELRENLKDYAIALAPEITDHARDAMLEIPILLRARLEQELLRETETRLAEFEREVNASLDQAIEQNLALLETELPEGTPEERLDAAIRSVSGLYRESMIDAVDHMYEDYSSTVTDLDDYLRRLQTADDLTETEKIDKRLIEVWMVLVHKHDFTTPEDF